MIYEIINNISTGSNDLPRWIISPSVLFKSLWIPGINLIFFPLISQIILLQRKIDRSLLRSRLTDYEWSGVSILIKEKKKDREHSLQRRSRQEFDVCHCGSPSRGPGTSTVWTIAWSPSRVCLRIQPMTVSPRRGRPPQAWRPWSKDCRRRMHPRRSRDPSPAPSVYLRK